MRNLVWGLPIVKIHTGFSAWAIPFSCFLVCYFQYVGSGNSVRPAHFRIVSGLYRLVLGYIELL